MLHSNVRDKLKFVGHFLRRTDMTSQTTRVLSAVLLATSLLFGSAQASEKKVKIEDLPKAVQKTVQEQSKGATIRGLAKEVEDGKTFYEAELTVNGHNKDVLMDPTGAVVEIEEQVALSSLPAEVKATIEKAAGKGKITAVESITKNNALEAYEAHVSRAGKKSEIKVAPNGTLITAEKEQGEKEEREEGKKAPKKTKKP
jgi:Putative beta-lactamase-inhibitor-like, PepSY-like